jgi:DNA-binding response OmpR family regulator
MSETTDSVEPVILITDDDQDILALVAFRLGTAGYQVVQAHDGEQALRLILDREFALAVLDVRMPELDGYEVTRAVRKNEAGVRTPVILMSASGRDVDVDRGFEAGADDYLIKPFSREELIAGVQTILARPQATRCLVGA